MQLTSFLRLPNIFVSIILYLPKYIFTEFDEFNPCGSEFVKKPTRRGFNKKLDTVDELFEAPNRQIFLLAKESGYF